MFFHPLIVGYVLIDLMILVLLAANLKSAFRISTSWSAGAATKEQLACEHAAEAVSLAGRTALVGLIISTVLFVVVVAELLPSYVPGAMCGTGVLQATGGIANRAALFRVLALGAFAVWSGVDKAARRGPVFEHATAVSKGFLVSIPLWSLASFDSLRMLWHLDLREPVDCCSVLYAGADMGLLTASITQAIANNWAWIFAVGLGVIVTFSAYLVTKNRPPLPPRFIWLYPIFVVGFAVLATIIVTNKLSSYYFGVLEHHCFWCLFLGEHSFAGYAIFTSLFGIAAFSLRLAATVNISDTGSRSTGMITLVNTAVFIVSTLLPALLWRFEHGVWID